MKVLIMNIVYVIYEILLMIPNIIIIGTVLNKKCEQFNYIKRNDIAIALIVFGIFNFPDNIYSKIIIGLFFLVLLSLNNKGISSNLLFPSSFFFNISALSGTTTLEGILMIIYSIVGQAYLYKLFNAKEMSVNEEKKYCIISSVVFLICKLCVIILKIFEQI